LVVKKCGREGGRGRGGCLRGGLFNNFQRTFGLVFIKRASERERERERDKKKHNSSNSSNNSNSNIMIIVVAYIRPTTNVTTQGRKVK